MSGSPPCPEGTDAATPTRDSPAGDASSPPLTGSTGEEGLEVASVDGEGLACGGCDPAEPTPEGEGDGSVEERPSAGLEGGHAAAPEEEADVVPTQRPEPGAPHGAFVPGDHQWRGEDHEMDKETGACLASAVSYENQRWIPLSGWSSSLLPSDRFSWSSRDGLHERRREDWPVPDVWGHPSEECCWHSSDWHIETTPNTDHAGWEYAVSFSGPYQKEKGSACFVRRRAWKRCARVQTEFAGACPQAKSAHGIKTARMKFLKRHEEARVRAFEAETKYGTSVQARVGTAATEVGRSVRHLKALSEYIACLVDARKAMVKTLHKAYDNQPRTPPKTAEDSSFVPLGNPVAAHATRLHEKVMNALGVFESTTSDDRVKNIMRSLQTASKHTSAVLEQSTGELRRQAKKVEAAHKEACVQFEHTSLTLLGTSVAAGETQLWLAERKYSQKNNAFSASLEAFKHEAGIALSKLQTAQQTCEDVWKSAEAEYWNVLTCTGFTPPSDLTSSTFDSEVADYTAWGERAVVDLLDSFHSEMVHKIGPLKMKGLTGYREYFAVLTMDKYLYLFNKGDEDGRASYTMYVGEGETHPRPESSSGAFTLNAHADGYLTSKSAQSVKLKCTNEEQMFDWCMALKEIRKT